MAKKFILVLLFTLLFSSAVLFAQGENLKLKVAVMGPGDELYFWWGHIALIIEDTTTDYSSFYDYGLFSFDDENFFYDFAFGRLLYSCGVSSAVMNIIGGYIETNRDVVIYELDVPAENRIEVAKFAQFNVLPANRDYYYHHFRDNCSTRIRDIIDLATDGQFFEQYGNAPGRYTLRQHVRRHTWFSPASDWFLSFLMGQGIDTPTTVWEEMFLPSEVGRRIDEFWYTDSNGERHKLVTSIENIYRAQGRPAVLDVPRKQWPFELAFSLALSAVFGFFIFMQSRKIRAGYVLTGFSVSLCGLFFGAAGFLLYFLSLFTNHDYTYNNANMFFYSPLLLAVVPVGICYALTKNPGRRVTCDAFIRLIWFISVIGILISMIIKILPWFWHQNLTDQMLLLPIALVFSFNPVGFGEFSRKYLNGKIFGRKKA